MGYIHGVARNQQTVFPTALDDLIPADHLRRVIDAFVGKLDFPYLVSIVPRLLIQAAWLRPARSVEVISL